MARGYFIHQSGSGLGVQAKIDAQVKALSVLGQVERLTFNMTLADRILNRLPLTGVHLDSVWDSIVEPDFLYIRKWVTDRQTLRFLARVKREYPKCLILLEIPTYPYDVEMASRPKDLPILVKDRWHRRALNQYVDRIVTFCGQEEILGVPTIMAANGIDVESVQERTPRSKPSEQIDLIAVATMLPQHGYDRVISGLAEYYRSPRKYRVMLHLVGEGPALKRYRRLSRSNHLDDYVLFHGPLTGEPLDSLYDYSDMGLVAFGMHRIGLERVSALKSREYLARGLPMAGGCPVDIFEGADFPYYLEFPNNDGAVSITEVVQFYEERLVTAATGAVSASLRQFAYMNCDMPIAMAPVINYLDCNMVRLSSS